VGFNFKAHMARKAAADEKTAAKTKQAAPKIKRQVVKPDRKPNGENEVRRTYDQVEWRFIDSMMPRRMPEAIARMMPQDGDDEQRVKEGALVEPLYVAEDQLHGGQFTRHFEDVAPETAAALRAIGAEQTEKLMDEFLEVEAKKAAKAAESGFKGSTTIAYEIEPMTEEQRAWLTDQITAWSNELELQLKSKLRVAEAKLHAVRDMHDELHGADEQEYLVELGLDIGVPFHEMKKYCPCVTATKRVRRLQASIKRLSKLVQAARERMLVEQTYTWTQPHGERIDQRGPDEIETAMREQAFRDGADTLAMPVKTRAAKIKQTARWEVKLYDDESGTARAAYIKVDPSEQIVRRRVLVGAPVTAERIQQAKKAVRKGEKKADRKLDEQPKIKFKFGRGLH
jgi:hypothetical protein